MGVVEAEARLQSFGEEHETAGHQQRPDAMLLQRREHDLRARIQLQAFVIHALQRAFVQSFQQCYAAAQALGEIDLAAHRLFGDRRHLWL